MINNLFYFKVAVDNLEVCCMDPDMEHHYKELLQLWKNDEDNIKDELKEIGTDVKDLTKKLDELVASTGTPVGQSSDEDGEYIETFKVAIPCIQQKTSKTYCPEQKPSLFKTSLK